jgi:DUF1680 family protein
MTDNHPSRNVIEISHSLHARLRPVPVDAVILNDTFWAPVLKQVREVTLPSQHHQLEITGRIDNFRRAAGMIEGTFKGYFFNDSDVYKWMEAAAWTQAIQPDSDLQAWMEELSGLIETAQRPDGYLNTYFTFEKADERWTNLGMMHELYCAGHFIQAAIACYRALGNDRLLKCALQLADHICSWFGPAESGKRLGTGGHEEIEMALVELWRTTGNRYFLDIRGRGYAGGSEYVQDHVPFRELDHMVGHAVRMLYLAAGAADIYLESGDDTIRQTLERLWEHMTAYQLYVNGAAGAHHQFESFGVDYLLPNQRAYAETCAAIASVMWNWRMLMLDGDARYADLMENTLYNAVLPGLGLDGQRYFYENPLADDGTHQRQPWFECACCPPNLARLLASLPGYFYSLSGEGIWVHLYADNQANITLADGHRVALEQHCGYPWDGNVDITLHGEGNFSLMLRVPAYTRGNARLYINQELFKQDLPGGKHIELRRDWKDGDLVSLHLPMAANLIESHPYVQENTGKAALVRGPLLYCLEGIDHPGIDLRDISIEQEAAFTPFSLTDELEGITGLKIPAYHQPLSEQWEQSLYRPLCDEDQVMEAKRIQLSAVPYFTWANRSPGQMLVWLKLAK